VTQIKEKTSSKKTLPWFLVFIFFLFEAATGVANKKASSGQDVA